MSLKTINRKSIRLELIDWPLGFIQRVILQIFHFTCMSAYSCSPVGTEALTLEMFCLVVHSSAQKHNNLTWLHRSGHWVLCGADHWSGYRPGQTHYRCLRRRKKRQKEEVWDRLTEKDERSQGIQLLILAASPLQQDQRDGVSVWHPCVFPVTAVGVDRGSTSNPVSLSSQPESVALFYLLLAKKHNSSIPP